MYTGILSIIEVRALRIKRHERPNESLISISAMQDSVSHISMDKNLCSSKNIE